MKRIRWRWSPSSIPEVAHRQWCALYETFTGPVGATVHLLEPEKDLPDMVFTASDMHTTWQWAKQIAASDWLGRHPYHPYGDWMKQIAPMETWERWRGGPMIFHQSPLRRLWEINFLRDLEHPVRTPPAKPDPQPSVGDRR
ncbi:MAG: hypothetical protein IH828_08725 [Nitrospinae bacterium]|nr:hypothetical protein [Nitrospinota bacterium]